MTLDLSNWIYIIYCWTYFCFTIVGEFWVSQTILEFRSLSVFNWDGGWSNWGKVKNFTWALTTHLFAQFFYQYFGMAGVFFPSTPSFHVIRERILRLKDLDLDLLLISLLEDLQMCSLLLKFKKTKKNRTTERAQWGLSNWVPIRLNVKPYEFYLNSVKVPRNLWLSNSSIKIPTLNLTLSERQSLLDHFVQGLAIECSFFSWIFPIFKL